MNELLQSNQNQLFKYNSSLNSSTQQKQQLNDCPICAQSCLQILINNALYHKHLDSQNIYFLRYVDNIIDDQLCPDTIKYKQMAVQDENQQFMRRLYSIQEYEYKNKAISEYYKFHKDYPKLYQKGVDKLMQQFYDRKKQFQYKKIKRVLKQQENISITTQKSSSVFSDIEQEQKKSHYSNVLNDLTANSQIFNQDQTQSQVFKIMCKKIEKAFQNKRFSPLNTNKKFVFDQAQNKQKTQTKNFASYLKKQQQKKDKQQKYKNFIRSNKQSRYNSIEHDSKQYSSGISTPASTIRSLIRKPQSNSSKNPFFYDGKFYNGSSTKGSTIMNKKQQKTKQQSSTPSNDNLQVQILHIENAFKKSKDSNNLNRNYGRQFEKKTQNNQEGSKLNLQNQFNLNNFKNKLNQKTTQQIYKNAAHDMKLKRRAVSYNSLVNINAISKRSSVVNIPIALREKDLEIKNRSSSLGQKLLKQKNGLISNQVNFESSIKNQRSSSSNNFRTTHSNPKFYQRQQIKPQAQRQNELNIHSMKKISIPKDVIKDLRLKSHSASKLKKEQNRSGLNSDEIQVNQSSKQQSKNKKQRLDLGNLYRQKEVNKSDKNNLFFTNHSANNVDIDRLLNKKLMVKVQSNKIKHTKILV